MARYNVIDRNTAATFGFKTDGEYNRHALVTMSGDAIDGLVCWGFKSENLQAIADKRNAELTSLKEKMTPVEVVDPLVGII